MSDKRLKSILVILITAIYYIYFYYNCIIIPYASGYDNYIIYNDQKNVFNRVKGGEDALVSLDIDEQKEKSVPDANHAKASAFSPASQEQNNQVTDSPEQTMEYPLDITGQNSPILSDSPEQTNPSSYNTTGQYGEAEPESTRQGNTRVLLSGSGTVKALSSLALKDKLWLVAILSRCSMEELLKITALLEDGVTYQENLEMYRILRQKVTDDEQKRLDALIEAYTK